MFRLLRHSARSVEGRRADGNPRISYGWIVVGVFFLIMMTTTGALGSFGVFIEPLTTEMGWSRGSVSGAASTLLFLSLSLAIFWGWLSERWSVRGVLAVGGALMGLGVLLAGTAQTVWQFYLYYGVIGGVGLSCLVSPMIGLTTRWIQHRPGLAMGIAFAGMGAGIAVMPQLAEYLISSKGWRFGFQVLGLGIWGVVLSSLLLLREPPWSQRREMRGAATGNTAAQGQGMGRSNAREVSRRRPGSAHDATLSRALRTRALWLLFGMTLIALLIQHTVLVHLVPSAEDAGVPSSTAVSFLTVLGLTSIVGKVVGGLWGDRVGPGRAYMFAMAVQTAAMLWLVASDTAWMYYVFAVVFGLSYGVWAPQLPATAVWMFGTRHMGAIWGAMSIAMGLGTLIGPTTAGFLFDSTGSYLIAFNLVAGAAVVAALLAFLLRGAPSWEPPSSPVVAERSD